MKYGTKNNTSRNYHYLCCLPFSEVRSWRSAQRKEPYKITHRQVRLEQRLRSRSERARRERYRGSGLSFHFSNGYIRHSYVRCARNSKCEKREMCALLKSAAAEGATAGGASITSNKSDGNLELRKRRAIIIIPTFNYIDSYTLDIA
jgi:hypothetical protein